MPDDETDAIALAERVGLLRTADEVKRTQAAMVRWALGALPPFVLELPPPGPWAAVVAAVERVAAGGEPVPEVWDRFDRWSAALGLDWATDQALMALRDCVRRVLASPADDPDDLGTTADELVRAHGLWLWDELLAEAGLSARYEGQESQDDVRDRVTAEAHRALAAILRRLPA